MIAHEQRTVAGSGERLDRHLLNAYPWLDRATAEDLVASGRVRLNGRPTKKGAKLAAGDVLDCREIPEPAADFYVRGRLRPPMGSLHAVTAAAGLRAAREVLDFLLRAP